MRIGLYHPFRQKSHVADIKDYQTYWVKHTSEDQENGNDDTGIKWLGRRDPVYPHKRHTQFRKRNLR